MCAWTTDPRGGVPPRAASSPRVRPSRDSLGGPGRLWGWWGARLAGALLLSGVLAVGDVSGAQPAAQEALRRAAALVQEGRLEEADRQAQLALSDPETRAVARSIQGVVRLQQERLDEGARLLEEAVRLEPGLLGAQLSLAQVYSLQGRGEQAVRAFRRVLELDPSNATARMALAGAETAKGDFARSLELARPALDAFERSPEGLSVLVTDYLKTGDETSAAGLARDWRQLTDVPAAASVGFAQLLAESGLTAEAIDVLEHAAEEAPHSYEVAFALGGAYVRLGAPAFALESYDRALVLKPDSLPALRQAAAAAERDGQLERSLSYWARARKLDPDAPEILLGFGRVCLRMDLLDDAEPVLTRAASLRPGVLAYQYTLAVAKVGKRQYEDAQRLLEPLVEAHPNDAQLQYALGSVLYVQGRPTESVGPLRESLKLDPDQVASRYYLALAARDQGHDDDAVELLEDLLRRYPDHAASCEALGGLLLKRQRYAEAERYLRKAVLLDPGSVRANYQLGLLLARTGRKEEADAQLARASSLRDEDESSSRLQLRLLDPES